MGFIGLLVIPLQCFDFLAWPLLAVVYPLCCSIRAIENNSLPDTQKLNAYWVVFSVILFFEHAFLKLLEWFPLWPYIRITIVLYLVMPHFDGAFYVYKHLICPCLMDPRIVINWFNNRRKQSLFIGENFLAEAGRHVKENGPEALERIVACEVCQKEPKLTGNGNSKFAAEIKEKSIAVAEDREIQKTPPSKKVLKEWTCAISQERTQSDTVFNSNLDGGQNQEVQKEWTHALCEVKILSETTLNSHLEHIERAACEALNAKNQAYVPKMAPAKSNMHEEEGNSIPSSGSKPKVIVNREVQEQERENSTPSSESKPKVSINRKVQADEEPPEGVSSNDLKRKFIINFTEKVQGQQWNPSEVPRMKDYRLWCNICSVHCPGEIDLASHLRGRKHKENVQERQRNANSVLRKSGPPLWCKICDVGCYSEFDMVSHLNGRRHLDFLSN